MVYNTFMVSTTTCKTVATTTEVCVKEYEPYIIDVGSSLMLGGLLAFFIAYWFIGLVRGRLWNT